MPAPVTILTVCTGNICRSPAAERMLQRELGGDGTVRVASAGIGALVGEPVHPPMAELVTAGGADVDGFAARRLTEAMITDATLVLGMAREHRAAVVELRPGAVRRTFTLREFARLAETVDPAALDARAGEWASTAERLRALIPLAAARRSQVAANEDDVVDPYRRAPEVYQDAYDQIAPAVTTIARVLRP
ncbi:low molecular weight phosphatase family protein [Georgenia sp. 10Sc9-8]|uniref:Low molecular weight phosphatase family protein n=1 Tax=Georgenia halotolerans TaxID=3028317 RepID=A0ABT5U102_9MICO|nr:low molecular weight phosphatase family protein [Georgenia halotolerans]